MKISTKVIIMLLLLIGLFFVIQYYAKKYKENQEQKLLDLKDQKFFTQIYEENVWDSSGIGSKPENSGPYLELIQSIFIDPRFKIIVDLGCGDWQLMSQINFPENKIYNGYDVVQTVIESNKKQYSKKNIRFYHISGLGDFSKVRGDLLVVKDVIQHWSDEQVKYFFKNILPNFKYALITNDYSKAEFVSDETDIDLLTAKYRTHGSVIDLTNPKYKVNNNLKVLLDYYVKDEMKRVYLYTNTNK